MDVICCDWWQQFVHSWQLHSVSSLSVTIAATLGRNHSSMSVWMFTRCSPRLVYQIRFGWIPSWIPMWTPKSWSHPVQFCSVLVSQLDLNTPKKGYLPGMSLLRFFALLLRGADFCATKAADTLRTFGTNQQGVVSENGKNRTLRPGERT